MGTGIWVCPSTCPRDYKTTLIHYLNPGIPSDSILLKAGASRSWADTGCARTWHTACHLQKSSSSWWSRCGRGCRTCRDPSASSRSAVHPRWSASGWHPRWCRGCKQTDRYTFKLHNPLVIYLCHSEYQACRLPFWRFINLINKPCRFTGIASTCQSGFVTQKERKQVLPNSTAKVQRNFLKNKEKSETLFKLTPLNTPVARMCE